MQQQREAGVSSQEMDDAGNLRGNGHIPDWERERLEQEARDAAVA